MEDHRAGGNAYQETCGRPARFGRRPECKFWKGPDSLHKAIDQLMGYMSWRDTKCAVVVLVRDTEMSTVLQKVPEVVRAHQLFKREVSVSEETWFRAVLQHPGDKNREATVTCMVFHLPRSWVPSPLGVRLIARQKVLDELAKDAMRDGFLPPLPCERIRTRRERCGAASPVQESAGRRTSPKPPGHVM